jgi:molecular chaperone GrpE
MADGTADLPDDPGASPAARVEALERELRALREEAEASLARLRTVSKAYADTQAEMRSYKERMEARAKRDSELHAYEHVKLFFDPVMNLRRSIQAAEAEGGGGDLVEGLRIVHQQFMEAMSRLGLEEVPGEGSLFDPNLHHAIALQPVTDPDLDGRVLEVHKAGYAVKGHVLQAAHVVIGKLKEPVGEA